MPEINILVADDEPTIRDVLSQLLENEGYRVFAAADGIDAVEIIRSHSIHLAILDIHMPRMNGIEALKEIKAIDPSIEALIITGNANLESLRLTIVENGAFDYILKPFFKKELLHVIRNALMKRAYLMEEPLNNSDRVKRLESEFDARTRQLRASQIMYKEIVENSGDSIMVYQERGLRYVNTNLMGLTGYDSAEVMELPFAQLLFPKDRELVIRCYDRIIDRPGQHFSTCRFRLMRKNGTAVWVEAGNKRTFWEDRPAVLSFCRDITEQKLSEALLKKSHEELEYRVEQRTQELTAANERLKKEITERKNIETNLKDLLKNQEIDIGLAKQILNLVNGIPSRYIDLSDRATLFVHGVSLPCLQEGGDHFFARTLTPGKGSRGKKSVISLKDQSGHSVNCVLRSIATDIFHQAILRQYNAVGLQTTIGMLNDFIYGSGLFQVEDFVTAITLEIDHDTLELQYLSNGHPPFLLIRQNDVQLLSDMEGSGRNMPLSWVSGQLFEVGQFRMRPGDKLLLFTDGFTENPFTLSNQMVSFEELRNVIRDQMTRKPETRILEIMNLLMERYIMPTKCKEEGGNGAGDDVTLIGMELEDQNSDAGKRVVKPKDRGDTVEMIRILYGEISAQWEDWEFTAPELRLFLVIEETILNAWKHGNRDEAGKSITVRWRFGNDFFFLVEDEGVGFAYDQIPDPTKKENLLKNYGRGIHLIRQFARSVSWDKGGRRIRVCLPKVPLPLDECEGSGTRSIDLWDVIP